MTDIPAAGYKWKVKRKWIVPQGADTTNAFRYGTVTDDVTTYPDLTDGWSARAQMREEPGSDVWVEFTSEAVSGPRIDLTADGYVTVILPAATTEATVWNSRTSGYYDVELVSSTGAVIRLAAGEVEVSPDVTRSE